MSDTTVEHELATEYITEWGSKTPKHVIVKCIRLIREMFEEYKSVGITRGPVWAEIEELFHATE